MDIESIEWYRSNGKVMICLSFISVAKVAVGGTNGSSGKFGDGEASMLLVGDDSNDNDYYDCKLPHSRSGLYSINIEYCYVGTEVLSEYFFVYFLIDFIHCFIYI